MQFICKSCAELLRIIFYPFNRNKNLSFYRRVFAVVLKRNDVSEIVVLQKIFVDIEKFFVGTKNYVELFQLFLLTSERLNNPLLYRR